MEARALCPSWAKQVCQSAHGGACSSTALLFGALLLCSLSTGAKPEGAPAVKPAMMGLKEQGGAGRCRTDSGTGNDRDLANNKEGARTQASEGAGVEGLGGGKKMSTAARAGCQSPALEEATPCLASCVCTSLAVNCSRSGLAEVPPGEPCSWRVTVLDLSHNHLSKVGAEELAGYPSLQVLDLSYNCIRTIEEGAFRHLGRLQSLKLVSNSLVCSCSLRWLGAWVREKGPLVSDAELLHCFQPAGASSIELVRVDFSALTCAADFISCVKDPETRRETVLLYSYLHPGTHSQASCHALCSQKAHTHYGLDLEDRCLCGSLGSKGDMDCGKVCSNEIRSRVCNRTVVHAVYPVQVSLSLSARPHYSLHEVIEFTAETLLPGTLYTWDFGDGGEQFSSSSPRARHIYALPGIYAVTVRAQVAGRSLLHRAAVSVILPVGPVGIECPRAVGRGESINIWIHSQQGTDLSVLWRMKMPSGQETLDESSCPQGGRIHLQNLNCYWLSHAQETWQDARRLCQGIPGGDLAVVRTQEVQSFLQETFSGAGVVWIGLSSLGSLRWVDGSLVDSFQNWTPFGRPEGKESCVQMHLLDPEGVWSSSPCSAKSSFLCERRAGVTLPSPDVFLTGVPVFSGVYDVRNVSTEPLPPLLGHDRIELMLFPGLWFSHAGILVSVDFGVQGTKKPVLIRFQILRPHCNPNQHLVPPGCELLHTPFACCHPRPLCNTTGWCPSGQQWCPLSEGCLNISSPCSSYAFENVTSSILPIQKPPRYSGTPPFYSPVADFPLLLAPSSANRHVQVLLPREEISVYPDDVIGMQHNAEVSSLLRCLQQSHSPWRQTYISLVKAGWWEGSISNFTNATWVDHVVCDLRVTFVGKPRSFAATLPLARRSERGAYTYTATVRNAVSSRQMNCTVEVQTQVGGLQIIHPTPVSGKLNVATKRETLIVIKILSGCNAVAHWMAPVGKPGVLFEATCPGSIVAHVPACHRDSADTWFSSALLRMEEPRMETLNVLVSNEISTQKLSVKIQSYNAIEGLRVVPPGPRRMLVDVSQVFSAELTQGSSVSYSWVIDNMDMFAYNGQTYSVKFKRPATYQLKLRAENPVSSEVVEVTLTAEAMNPLANPEIVGLPEVVEVDILQTLVFRVEVDTAMEVTVRWGFGDGSPDVESLLSPPYDSQLSRPDPQGERVQVLARVTHTYTQPGDYSVTAEAINKYDRVKRVAKVRAVCPIASVTILVTPASPLVNEVTKFKALPRPSPYGVVYSWNFSDGSPTQEGVNSLVHHCFEKSGVYNVMLRANNSLSEVPSDVAVMVSEGVTGLRVVASGPTELGSATVVNAVLASGTDVLWTFNMGDGFVYSNLNLSFVSHTFAKEGNYTVTVMAHNAATSTRVSTIAEVYRLQITNILAPICLSSGEQTPFQAVVTGPSEGVQFCWDFQDGNPASVGDGDPTVFHSYPAAGSYELNLTVRGIVSTTSRQLAICVEDQIRSVKLTAPTLVLALGEPTCFQAEVVPVPDPQHQYQYHWDFDVGEDPVTSGSPEITFTYLEGGSYRVTVTVWNTVSRQNASADILAQRVIGTISILHSGETESFLALGTSYLFTAEVPWDSVATFLWNFGDHSPSQVGQSASHTYHTAGDITVTVTGENQVSRRNASLDITVLAPVRLLALSTERPVCEVRQEVTFHASLAAGDQVRYLWAIGEPRGFQKGATTFSHAFPAAGVFVVFVAAENAVSTEKANITIEVQERAQGVQIHSGNVVQGRYLASAEPFMLTAEVTQGSNLTFRWVISLGLRRVFTATGQSLTYCYNASGELLVEVRAGNMLGEASAGLALQMVERACGVKVRAASDSVAVGKPVNLSVSVASGTDLLYSWHTEENAQPLLTNSSSLSYAYSTLGSKLVFVTVSNILGSSNGSTELRVQEPVSRVSFTVEGSSPPFFLTSDTSRQLWGSVAAGSDVAWEWQLRGKEKQQLFCGQNVSCKFSVAGVYQVDLRAWNDVSEDTVQHPVAVQDPVAGLAVEVDRQDVCTDDRVVFTLHTQRGTNVSFALTVPSLGLRLHVRGGTHHFSFPAAGSHRVLASASNNVSVQLASVVVQVLEKVRGLHILNCCPAVVESSKELALTAQVRAGENVTFFWIFHLPGHPAYEAAGQQVGYVPPGAGNLTIHVEASNPFCAASLTVTVALQVPIEAATLSSNGTGAFLNQTVAFDVAVMGGSDLRSEWKFGDSEETFAGGGDERMFHRYGRAGDFLVEVKIYNEVSFVLVQTTVTVRELGCDSPMVRLVEPPSSVPRSRTSYFEASIDLKGCTAYKALYLWEVFSSASCEQLAEADQVPLQHADLLTPSLTLPKLSLDIGTHCLRFTASLQHTPLARTLSLLITVIPTKLVPVIRGGSWRSWSAHLDLVLDGSGSYDPDVGTDADPSLEYHWGCENVSSPRCAPPHLQGGASITVPRTALCRGTGYRFILTVKKLGKEPVSVAQMVWIEPGQILPVTIECRSCSALSSYEISRSVHVTLAGQCQSCDNRTMYKWMAQSSDGQNLTLDHVTTSTGDSNRDLVIRQGVLRDGVNYSFTLSASQPGGELQGGSSITLTPNNPPRGGVCTLTPEHNLYLLETLVSYQCTGWVDEDSSPVQLIYTLIAERCSPGGRHCQHFCLYRGIKSSFGTFLPAAPGGSRTVNVLVELEDSQGAKTLALNRTLTLAMPVLLVGFPTVTSWLKNKSQSELWGVVQQGNPQEVIPYSLALITVLNQNSGSQGNEEELRDRISIRSNVTAALASLNISSVKEVAQLSAALQQCVAFPGELSLESQARTLAAAQRMIEVISSETEEGHETPTSAGNSILGILGSTLSALDTAPHPPLSGAPGLSTALTAFNLTRALMKSLMRSRVLNEETLLLSVSEIHTQGKRANSPNLLCLAPSEQCLFSVPSAVARQLAGSQEVVQVLMDISVNPFPFNYYANSSISTRLALLEFTTPRGAPIPVSNLSGERAIGLRLPTGQQEQQSSPPTLILLPPGESVNFTVRALAGSRAEGVHIRIGITVQEGFDPSQEREPSIRFYGHYAPVPNEFHYAWKEEMLFDSRQGGSSGEVTILLSSPHSFNGTLRDYHVNITNRFSQAPVSAAVTVFASLCQYFHFPSMQWSTEGLRPTAATSRKEIVCLTEHLTVFGASFFVPPHSILFLPPNKRARQAPLVVITCCVLFAIYLGMVLIAHKLDDIDITRVGVVPRCGQPGRYKYWVMVKTGWKRGSGTTAHVGISLYGLNKSGSRHLDKGWAFQRNSQDIFQVETDANLGEIWKIRIWHDNTGLDPSWYLQHVIVWDRQTDHMYFFLVDDWLSVENEQNEGLVEKEVLAACPQELRCFSRVFPAQLRLGFSDWHVWLSVWGRSPHSRFTRVQRITCCVLAVYLFLAICVLWYGAIGVEGYSVPLGSQVSVTAESVAVGMVVAVVVFPIQLLFTFIFRKTRSKVVVEDPDPPVQDSQTVEMDVCLEHADLGSSSFLSIPGGMESIMDGSSVSGESPGSRRPVSTQENLTKVGNARVAKRWPSCDSIFDVPDLLNSDLLVSQSRILKRKKALLKLGIESASSSDDDPLSFSLGDSEDSRRDSRGHRLTRSEEDLLNSIVAETQRSSSLDCVTSDSGRFSPRAEADLVSDVMESPCSAWSDGSPEQGRSGWGFLRKSFSYISALTSPGSALLPDPEPLSAPVSSFSTRIGVSRRPLEWLFPGWALPMTYAFIFLLLAGCFTVTILYGSSLHDHTALMWLISCIFSFITSFVLLEPLKVVLEALRAALITKPVDSEGEGLVEEPLVKPVPERIGKVRAPCGYGLLQAKEEARKVRALRALMRSCLTHMLFLLVVLTVNYQSCFHHRNIHLLHAAVRQAVTAPNDRGLNFSSVRSYSDTWEWIDSVLLSYLYNNPRLTLIGVPRLRQESSAGNVPLDLVLPQPGLGSLLTHHVTNRTCPLCHLSAPRPEVSRSGQVDRDACSDPSLQNSSHDSSGFWIWGHVGVYHTNTGCWRELGNSSAEARRTLADLRASNWINKRTRAVFLEFTQYNVDVNLYVAVMLLLELPSVRPAVPSIVILPCQMLRLGTGLDLPFALVISLLVFSVAFLLPELSLLSREGASCLGQSRCWLQLLLALLSIAVGALHFAHIWLADVQLEHYWGHRQAFTSFYEVALLARMEICLSALLLTITTLKIVRQLRFVRRWSAFGKTFQHALGELVAATLLFLLLLLVYAQCGYLAFSATVEEFRTFQCAFYALLSALHGKVAFLSVIQEFPTLGTAYVLSFTVSLLCVGSRFLCAVILQGYRTVQAEMYRPAIEPQDYEMIEFFVKRFKLWMGFSKTKEFRHKVKFEGMDSLISRSSGNSKRSRLLSAGTIFRCASSTISSSSEELALSESPVPEPYNVQFYLDRLPSAVNNLLDQFDRVIRVMEDVCQLERGLEQAQKRINDNKKGQKSLQGEKVTPAKQLELPRTYSTFSESALVRLRTHRAKVSNCNATDGHKLVQWPPADGIPHPVAGCTSWLVGPPISTDLCQRLTQAPGISCKWRPKSEEGQGCLCHEIPQRQIPLKRRAWQAEGAGNM
nr:polycystin-1-like isoform X1 [Chrysemys picta bellii]XP_042697021.1 polycystin-1-like isoform X1 [Chrysemys picta bellii]XP_042697022.1 polycystin-1-like isoform X1 [Chrysemys picta bellii]XP_042697023.1 polycystin-1-like isoform X1 [Chrysemys picta bellii]